MKKKKILLFLLLIFVTKHVKGHVFDKKSGTVYYTNLKQYVDIKGDKYQFD